MPAPCRLPRTLATGTRRLTLGLAAACHPAPTVAVTAVAALLAAGVGLSPGRIALFAAAVLTGQLSIGWSNDRIDSARDKATGRADKPATTGRVPVDALWPAALAALATTAVLSALLGWRAGLAALLLVAAGWAYNLGLKATQLSGLAYVIGFGALPAAPYLALPGHPWPPWWAPATGALLGLGAHFANVLPDLLDDANTGIRGLPQRLGRRRGILAMTSTLAGASLVLGFGPGDVSLALGVTATVAGLVAAGTAAVLASRNPDSSAAFRLTLAIAVLDVALFLVVTSRS